MENNLFKSGVLLFALGSMSCISLWAQGTVEDYNRAYALREKYNAKHVLYAGVVPHWVDQTSAFCLQIDNLGACFRDVRE